jgi:sugar phosphate isomerase/epimerase
MAALIQRYNDGSDRPPRLRLSHSLWSLSKLPMNGTEWSLAEKVARVRDAGFEAIECWLTPENEAGVTSALAAAGLRLALGHHPFTLDDTRATVARARRLGADYIFGQPGDAFVHEAEAAALVRDGRALASDEGVPYFVESHRNTITETLPQTYRLIERVPDVRFTADLSHYFLVGEFYGWESERLPERLAPILERTSGIHGRISNGEQIQVDVGDGSVPTARTYVALWTQAMKAWLRDAVPGDVFPFASELGPPAYAIRDPSGAEISDRWEQSLVMKRLAEEAWAAAVADR